MTCFTAIIGNYEELKEPLIVSPGWKYICFTDQPLTSNIWHIKKVEPSESKIRTARAIKILFHNYIKDKYSMWVDASFQINCDLNEWWETRFQAPFTCIQHPIRTCVYEEAKSCLANGRGNYREVDEQVKKYKRLKVPSRSFLIQSGILMRQRTWPVIDFCEAWYNELMQTSTRDQLSFVYAAHQNPIHNLTEWNYRTSEEFIYTRHYHKRKGSA